VLKNFIVLTHPPPARQDSPYLDKAAGEKATEAYLRRYVEEGFEPRTTLRNFFSTLLCR
jgi:outer membrane receptor for Fe3+-dicitrate